MRHRPAHRLAKRLRDDGTGVTVIEFGAIAPVLLLFIMGFMDLTHRLYIQSVLSGAMQQAGRNASLETGSANTNALDQQVVAMVSKVAGAITWTSSHESFADYSKIGPEPFNDTNGNGVHDAGECYSDVNNNGTWDADPGTSGTGGAKDSVIYTMKITYQRWFPLAGMLGWSSQQQVSATTVFKNQPFSSQTAATVQTLCN